jgi:ADP-heptose:LPS heptosyltransferase
MSLQNLRKIDSLLGLVPVTLLSLLLPKKTTLGEPAAIIENKKVLCVKLIGFGSAILSLQLLKKLKENGYEVHFLTLNGNAEFLKRSAFIDRIWSVSNKSVFGALLSSLRMLLFLRKHRFSVYIDLEPTSNLTALLGLVLGIPHRLGFMCSKESRESLFTSLVSYSSSQHISKRYLSFLELLSLPNAEEGPDSPLNSGTFACSNSIVINPNCSDLSFLRLWPRENWVELVVRLMAKFSGFHFYFVGLGSEFDYVESIVKGLPPERVQNLSGKTDIVELQRLLSEASLVVSVDSGTMHLADFCKAPLVALFGPESPKIFGPLSKNSTTHYKNLPCSPCLLVASEKVSRCQDNRCMKEIKVADVFQSCIDTIERSSKRSARAAA